MKQILALARKELRGYFLSPVALIFLGTFLFVVLFSFFWVDTFFRRNLADVRPLFHWLPVLLIFLVSALTMRLWSEEQRMGTLELLLTLPVRTHRLVLGKFLAGLGLVAVALALTVTLPITVAFLGPLDWGPVIGGYLAALLLAAAYLAIGLCISSTTDNPIVALIGTVLACGAFYLLGTESVASFAGNRGAEVLRAVGTGSRFESIQRGVIDLRDLLYYASLTGGFLFLNVALLEAKRWSDGERSRVRRRATRLAVLLLAANLVLLNVLASGVRAARLDLTERKEYSISPVTAKLLHELDAPLLIRGYFSSKTHPLLAPLVPRIRDLIKEYGAVGGSLVRAEFLDPRQDGATEREANEDYGIKSVPLPFADRYESALVNSYFSVLVKYGDKYEKLDFDDLIELKVTGYRDMEVRLRNLEYDLTRAVKKVVHGFQPLETLFSRLGAPVTLSAYVTPKSLPESLKDFPKRLERVAAELARRAGGRFKLALVDPSGPGRAELREELQRKYGFKPLSASLLAEETFYLHLLLTAGDKHERVYPAMEMTEADLRNEVQAALKRLAPGFLKTVGLVVPSEAEPPAGNPMARRPPPMRRFELLKAKLGETYTVKELELKSGRVPGEVDTLLVVGAQDLDEKSRFALDQYLMRGGALIVCAGRFAMDASPQGGLGVKGVKTGLEELLAGWGVTLREELVLDPQNEAFPVPVDRDVGGYTVRELQLLPYPFFVDVRQKGMAEDHPTVGRLPSVTLQWVSPLEVKDPAGAKSVTLLRSSGGSWTQKHAGIQPDFAKHPEKGFGPGEGGTKAHVLAALLTGRFESGFKDKRSPLEAAPKGGAKDQGATGGEATGRVLKSSPEGARLAVVGSGEFLNDAVLEISRQTGSDRFTSNLQLAQNLVDWSVADVDLLTIRSRGAYARTLAPMDDAARSRWELGNYLAVVALLGLLVAFTLHRRRSVKPLPLVPADGGAR
ncbi:MAG: Gldg family protein [Deltaproteobacteria bacterium]|nr:Gldg family protein [Deltaproteobacteria bacterium]